MPTDSGGLLHPEAVALRSFGWTLGAEFEERYCTDPWVFNLVNALGATWTRAEQAEADRNEAVMVLRETFAAMQHDEAEPMLDESTYREWSRERERRWAVAFMEAPAFLARFESGETPT